MDRVRHCETYVYWTLVVIYSPNSVLATKNIINIRRSPNQIEVVEIHVDFQVTSTEI